MSLLTNFQDLANTVKLALDRKADKSELATKADKNEIPSIAGKEDTANKVTSLSSSSTDTEYPSAKCVYDELQTIPVQGTITSGSTGYATGGDVKTYVDTLVGNADALLGSGVIS